MNVKNYIEQRRQKLRMLRDRYIRGLMHIPGAFSVSNMSPRDLREAFIEDLLNFHFWEKEHDIDLEIDWYELTYFMPDGDKGRLNNELQHPEIAGLFEMKFNTIYKLRTDRESLQAAMDYTGIWFEGFKPPEDEQGVLMINRETLESEVTKHGGIDNLAKSLSTQFEMDQQATVPGNNTLN